MISQYAICLVFTKDNPGKIRIETIICHGTIEHQDGSDPKDLFDKEKAVNDGLKDEKCLKLLRDGNSFFLANHIILPQLTIDKQ